MYRVPGQGDGSVLAKADEIDAWLESAADSEANDDSDAEPTGRRPRWAVLSVLSVLSLVGIGALVFLGAQVYGWLQPPRPSTVRLVDGRHWVVENVGGAELWRRSSARPLRKELRGAAAVTELGGGGEPAVIVVMPIDEVRDRIVAYDAVGDELWAHTPGLPMTLDGISYDGRYQILGFTVLEGAGGDDFIVVSAHHRFHYPALLVLLDSSGEEVSSYVHAGWITEVNAIQLDDDPGDELIFGAINNPLARPTLGVLDVPFAPGVSPGIDEAPASFPRGLELAYLALPRSRTSAALSDHSWVEAIVPDGQGGASVQVSMVVHGEESPYGEYMYEFEPGLRFERARFTDLFRSRHEVLRSEGRLDFALDDEVELGPPEWLVGRSSNDRARSAR